MTDRPASVIVRCLDEAPALERALTSLREQSVRPQVVVVDSGSTDGSVDVARRLADTVVTMPREAFTYGGALNLGARHADAAVHLALSAHCVAGPRWVERSLHHLAVDGVAAAGGRHLDPDGRPIGTRYLQTTADADRHPFWGLSNHASSWRREVWEAEPFRTDLAASEDLEWSWRVLGRGWTIAFAPDIAVAMPHRRRARPDRLWRKIGKETVAVADLRGLPAPSVLQMARNVVVPDRRTSTRPALLRVVSPYRVFEVVARDAALRRAQRARETLR
jgi:rhamnosyltransferase